MLPEKKIQEAVKLTDVLNAAKKWQQYLFKKWWLIAIFCISGGILGVIYAHFKKASYESELSFALEDSQSGMGAAFSLAAEFGLSLGSGSGAFTSDNIIGIIKSRRIIEQVLLSLDTVNGKSVTMVESYLNLHGMKEGYEKDKRLRNISFPPNFPRTQFTPLQDSILYVVYEKINNDKLKAGKKDKKSSIYEINYTDTDERFAKVFTEKLISETIAFYTELRSKKSKETLEILEARTTALRGSVNSAISSKAATQDANINTAIASAQAPLQKKQIDISVYGVAYQELYKNLELARYQYLKDIPLLQIIDRPQFPLKKNKAGRLMTGIKFSFLAGFLIIIILSISHAIKNALIREEILSGVK
jgi:uncharacterized protein involved in exopolysaccharide biosynthesis